MFDQNLNARVNQGRSVYDITRDAVDMLAVIGPYSFDLIDRSDNPYVGSMQYMVKLSSFVSLSIIRCTGGDVADLTDPNNFETAIMVDGNVDNESVRGGQSLRDVGENIRAAKIAAVLIGRRRQAAALLYGPTS